MTTYQATNRAENEITEAYFYGLDGQKVVYTTARSMKATRESQAVRALSLLGKKVVVSVFDAIYNSNTGLTENVENYIENHAKVEAQIYDCE